MIETTTQIVDTQIVTAINPGDGAAELTFERGLKALLPADHPDQEILLSEADRSLRHHHPVGVLVNQAGQVVDLRYALQTSVRRVQDCEEDPNNLEVGFWGYSPVCYLTPDHPEFERIRTTLERAVASGSLVWLAPHNQEVVSGMWVGMKIMDVRPVSEAATPQLNGPA